MTGYQVTTDGGSTWTSLSVTGDGTLSATVGGLVDGQQYTFQVRAVNGTLTGQPSDQVTETPQSP